MCVCVCVHVCVRACVHACVCVCDCALCVTRLGAVTLKCVQDSSAAGGDDGGGGVAATCGVCLVYIRPDLLLHLWQNVHAQKGQFYVCFISHTVSIGSILLFLENNRIAVAYYWLLVCLTFCE